MTVETLDEVYGHHSPAFQANIAAGNRPAAVAKRHESRDERSPASPWQGAVSF